MVSDFTKYIGRNALCCIGIGYRRSGRRYIRVLFNNRDPLQDVSLRLEKISWFSSGAMVFSIGFVGRFFSIGLCGVW